jgi:exopolyphosphatase/pppGpp-phosphohydrolase
MLDICKYFSFKSALCLGEKYDVNGSANHEIRVGSFAAAIFDETMGLHKLSEMYRNILCCSALIHDIGYFVSKAKHHKHTRYIILNDSMLDAVPNSLRRSMAIIASSHRRNIDKGIKHYDRDERKKLKMLISILRISDALDSPHKKYTILDKIVLDKKHLTFYIDSSEFQKTLIKFNTKSKLFNDIFNIETRLEPK